MKEVIKSNPFTLSTSVHGMKSIQMTDATPAMHDLITRILTCNIVYLTDYKMTHAAGAFFQGGSQDRLGGWILIEFWHCDWAEKFISYANSEWEKFMRNSKIIFLSDEQRLELALIFEKEKSTLKRFEAVRKIFKEEIGTHECIQVLAAVKKEFNIL